MCDRMHACMCACGACQNETDHFKNLQTRFTPCCGFLRMLPITVSNCIIKQHNLRQRIVTVAAVRLKPTILENLEKLEKLDLELIAVYDVCEMQHLRLYALWLDLELIAVCDVAERQP